MALKASFDTLPAAEKVFPMSLDAFCFSDRFFVNDFELWFKQTEEQFNTSLSKIYHNMCNGLLHVM